ncbi:hypothetical protein V1281_005053 [Nitrobacteraceae bacterium AZCC 2161]
MSRDLAAVLRAQIEAHRMVDMCDMISAWFD